MKQLLATNGMAGIILPSSILSNSGIYTKAREIILQHFEVIAITEFGGITFGATSTNTVALFLKKRDVNFMKDCGFIADDFVLNQNAREHDFVNSKQLFKSYISLLKIDFEEYQSFVNRDPNEEIKETDFYKSYQDWFNGLTTLKYHKKKKAYKDLIKVEQEAQLKSMFFDFVLEIERDKFFNFLLTHKLQIEKIAKNQSKKSFVLQKTLIVKSGSDNTTQKSFLGYSFSNRRGYKGIAMKPSNKMYDMSNQSNTAKVNSYIYKAFLGEQIPEIHKELTEHLKQVSLVDCINFSKIDFDKRISLSPTIRDKVIKTKWSLKRLGEVCDVKIGGTPLRANSSYFENGTHLWVSISEMKGHVITDTKEKLTQQGVENSNVKLIKKGTTLLSFKLSIGKVAIAGNKLYTNEAIAGLEIQDKYKSSVLDSYIYFLFESKLIDLVKDKKNAMGVSLNSKYLKSIEIPVPPKDTQKLIIKEIEAIEKKEKKIHSEIEKIKLGIYSSINSNTKEKVISDLCTISSSKENPAENPEKDYNYVGLEYIESNTSKFLEWKSVKGVEIKSTKNVFNKGQVLYGKLRPYLNKVVIADFDGICSTDILVLNSENPNILKYILLADNFVKQASGKMSGVSLPRIKVKDFLNLQVSFPKQTEIDTVNKSINKSENKITKLEQSISNTETAKREILKKYLEE